VIKTVCWWPTWFKVGDGGLLPQELQTQVFGQSERSHVARERPGKHIHMFVNILSNRFKGSAWALCDLFPFYAISAAYNLPIKHNDHIAQRRVIILQKHQ